MNHNGEVTKGMAIDDIPLTHDPLDGFDRLVLREVTPGYVGEAADCASAVSDVLSSVRRLADISTQLSDHELTAAARSLALVMQQAEATLVAVTTDAIDRGTITSSTAADATQWIGRLSRNEPLGEIIGQQGASNAGPLIPLEPAGDKAAEPTDNDDVTLIAGLEPGHCSRLGKLATACRAPRNAVLLDAIVTGRANTTIGKTALDAVGPIAGVLPAADREQILSLLLDLGPGAGAKSVRELTRRIIATFAQDDAPDVEEDTLQAHESVSWSMLPTGLIRFIADLSPDHAEMLKHAIQSMAAPAPGSDCCNNHHHRHRDKKRDKKNAKSRRGDSKADSSSDPATGGDERTGGLGDSDWDNHHDATDAADDWTAAGAGAGGAFGARHDARPGEPDLRAPSKRRADALVELLRIAAQAVDTDGDIKSNGTARIVVTMDYERLRGALNGLGVSHAGTGVTPDTIRQLACDAEIIPMVLGSPTQPLNVGRKKRLVDKELRAAVIHRDQHCTFQGCSRPPVMCEVHHVKYWWKGGETSLLNSALLCPTHHRIVHRENLTATVTHKAVTWHPAGTKRANTAAA